jgi:hypothetical protein
MIKANDTLPITGVPFGKNIGTILKKIKSLKETKIMAVA